MSVNLNEIEKKLWASVDQLRTNSKLKTSEYSTPVLGLIFLRYVDYQCILAERELRNKHGIHQSFTKSDYQGLGVMYVPAQARFSYLVMLEEDESLGWSVNKAMQMIETENEVLRDVLPRNYHVFEPNLLHALLSLFSEIPMEIEGDFFGRIYEYFLGNFAIKEGQKGGEFFTPISLVKLIVEVIEPYHGRILDPACGSGSMFVQSARLVERRKRNPNEEIMIYGQEKVTETIRICKMNLAVHGLSGDIRQGNTFYENLHQCLHSFDYVMANPPFNVDGVDKEKLKNDPRYPFGIPKIDNANYLWIQEFYSALNETGRSGFVMANSAADARGSEQEIRRQLIETGVVDCIIAVGANFFYNVTLPCTLWFLDKGKQGTDRSDKILFIDARQIYKQVDRSHREFSPEQIAFLADVVRAYRGNPMESDQENSPLFNDLFPERIYRDCPGFCKMADLKEIAILGWSLNPGRYVGISEKKWEKSAYKTRMLEYHRELERLNLSARKRDEAITRNLLKLLEGIEDDE